MIPKAHRLPGSYIPPLIAKGRRISGPYTTLIYQTEVNAKTARVTVIVPIRLSKRAVTRNRTKRLLREALKPILPHVKDRLSIIVMARTLLERVDHKKLTQSIRDSFSDAHLLTNTRT